MPATTPTYFSSPNFSPAATPSSFSAAFSFAIAGAAEARTTQIAKMDTKLLFLDMRSLLLRRGNSTCGGPEFAHYMSGLTALGASGSSAGNPFDAMASGAATQLTSPRFSPAMSYDRKREKCRGSKGG